MTRICFKREASAPPLFLHLLSLPLSLLPSLKNIEDKSIYSPPPVSISLSLTATLSQKEHNRIVE